MVRLCLLVVISVAVPGANAAFAQRPAPLQPGKKLEAELTEKMAGKYYDKVGFGNDGYLTVLPVKLKAGQPIEITANVVGDKRRVVVWVVDSTNKEIAKSDIKDSSQSLKVKNANATGTYGVVIWSDRIGAFDLIAEFDGPEALTLAAAKAKVESLKKELAAAEKELKKLEDEAGKKAEPKKP